MCSILVFLNDGRYFLGLAMGTAIGGVLWVCGVCVWGVAERGTWSVWCVFVFLFYFCNCGILVLYTYTWLVVEGGVRLTR